MYKSSQFKMNENSMASDIVGKSCETQDDMKSVSDKELVQNSYKNNQRDAQNNLVIQYIPAVQSMAYRLKGRLPENIEIDELVSIGNEELVRLARKYDERLNDSFWGYAKKRVYGSMLDHLRKLDFVSRSDRKLIKDIEKVSVEYEAEFDKEPSDAWLAKKLGEEVYKVKKARYASDVYSVMPLDEQVHIFYGDTIQKQIEEEELIETVELILKEYPKRDQTIIQLYFFEELNLRDISEIMDITESRISQIIKNITKKIKQRIS